MRVLASIFFAVMCARANAQWTMQESHTTASLRGIHNVGAGVAWASGTDGTVIRTMNEGSLWERCVVPRGAEKLDFRGIQAFDAETAVVMSSGKGDLSRVYKTVDGCKSWKLVFTNPDKDGFWDAIKFLTAASSKEEGSLGVIVGDPVDGEFPMFLSFDRGDKWERQIKSFPRALKKEGLFAASDTSLLLIGMNVRSFVTGGTSGVRMITYRVAQDDTAEPVDFEANVAPGARKFVFAARHMQVEVLPTRRTSASAGAFSIASRPYEPGHSEAEIIVGGDYETPNSSTSTAWYFDWSSLPFTWQLAHYTPHGYRSAVAWDAEHKVWITVGPNGTDVSVDDGKNWRALTPGAGDVVGADRGWNALSLPFVVGPKGRVGRLHASAVGGLGGK